MAEGNNSHKDLEEAILYTLAYFDIFQHPLNLEEIIFFAPIVVTQTQVAKTLDSMFEKGYVFQKKGFYGLVDRGNDVETRIHNNDRANLMLPKAISQSKLIQEFPFVKGACVSGSLSKGVFKDQDDIDFFVIGSKNRIWLSKLFLTLYRVLRLNNSREHFCLNYFISEIDLEIKEKNFFTAIELLTMIPMASQSIYIQLQEKNKWVFDFLPNASWQKMSFVHVEKPLNSRLIEKVLFDPFSTWIDRGIMKTMKWRFRKKFNKLSQMPRYEQMFRSTPTESKAHAGDMSGYILNAHKEKLESLITTHESTMYQYLFL